MVELSILAERVSALFRTRNITPGDILGYVIEDLTNMGHVGPTVSLLTTKQTLERLAESMHAEITSTKEGPFRSLTRDWLSTFTKGQDGYIFTAYTLQYR